MLLQPHRGRTDDLKEGTLVGEDKYGNRYYENNNYCIGKNRWVRRVVKKKRGQICTRKKTGDLQQEPPPGLRRQHDPPGVVRVDPLQDGLPSHSQATGGERKKHTEKERRASLFSPFLPPSLSFKVHYKWMTDHSPNPSGTYSAYVPYSTTRPKIQSWRPGQKKKEERKQEGEEEGKERQQ